MPPRAVKSGFPMTRATPFFGSNSDKATTVLILSLGNFPKVVMTSSGRSERNCWMLGLETFWSKSPQALVPWTGPADDTNRGV